MAANQTGKTLSGGYEYAMHATCEYPDWWEGHTFDHPIVGWVAGEGAELTRDGPQRILMGRALEWGTGAIPADRIVEIDRRSHGVKDAIETVYVRWGGGGDVQAGTSIIGFKSYDQGRIKFQAETLDIVWFDEEPDLEIYTEGSTRTNATHGIVFMTFTPLKGMTSTVLRFLQPAEDDAGAKYRHVTNMTLDDATFYTQQQRDSIIGKYPPHERDARLRGIPMMGSGLVFPIADETIMIDPFPIEDYWYHIGGMDFGYDHPSAGIELVWDKDNDICYLVREARESHLTPMLFAQHVRPWGKWLPWAWPHDGLRQDKDPQAGRQLAKLYEEQDMNMLPMPASFSDEKLDNSVEAGVQGMYDAMQAGRFKVFRTCKKWFEEKRMYHRKEGVIVKLVDDLISASRYAWMMRRHAIVKPRVRPDRQVRRAGNYRTL